MKQHFMQVQSYQTKNKAHAEAQQFVEQYDNCLIDDIKLEEFKEKLYWAIYQINKKYPRCQDISSSATSFTDGHQSISIEGNFHMSIVEVKRFELSLDQEPTSLSVMDRMTKDDNQGIRMSSTVTGVKEVPQGSIISFGVENQIGKDALAQVCGHPGEYMIFCMAVNKAELEKTREKMKGGTK